MLGQFDCKIMRFGFQRGTSTRFNDLFRPRIPNDQEIAVCSWLDELSDKDSRRVVVQRLRLNEAVQ